nr:pectinesterase 2-like [Ipomoea batatas]
MGSYGELANTGPGAQTANRVRWPGYHGITIPARKKQQDLGSIISSMETNGSPIECPVFSGSLTQWIGLMELTSNHCYRNAVLSAMKEMPVVGGSGLFR